MAGQIKASDFTLDDKAFRVGLLKATKNLELRSEQDLDRLVLRIQNRARMYAPVDTGRLRASINVLERGRTASGPYRVVGTNVEYAWFVEAGTRVMTPQPFFRPALLEEINAWRPNLKV